MLYLGVVFKIRQNNNGMVGAKIIRAVIAQIVFWMQDRQNGKIKWNKSSTFV